MYGCRLKVDVVTTIEYTVYNTVYCLLCVLEAALLSQRSFRLYRSVTSPDESQVSLAVFHESLPYQSNRIVLDSVVL